MTTFKDNLTEYLAKYEDDINDNKWDNVFEPYRKSTSKTPDFTCAKLNQFLIDNEVFIDKYLTIIPPYAYGQVRMNGHIFDFSNIIMVGNSAFDRHNELVKIDLSTVQYIDYYAFYSCEKLKEVHLKEIQFIKDGAFQYCGDGITPVTIYYHGTKEQWNTVVHKDRNWHKWTDVKIKFVK